MRFSLFPQYTYIIYTIKQIITQLQTLMANQNNFFDLNQSLASSIISTCNQSVGSSVLQLQSQYYINQHLQENIIDSKNIGFIDTEKTDANLVTSAENQQRNQPSPIKMSNSNNPNIPNLKHQNQTQQAQNEQIGLKKWQQNIQIKIEEKFQRMEKKFQEKLNKLQENDKLLVALLEQITDKNKISTKPIVTQMLQKNKQQQLELSYSKYVNVESPQKINESEISINQSNLLQSPQFSKQKFVNNTMNQKQSTLNKYLKSDSKQIESSISFSFHKEQKVCSEQNKNQRNSESRSKNYSNIATYIKGVNTKIVSPYKPSVRSSSLISTFHANQKNQGWQSGSSKKLMNKDSPSKYTKKSKHKQQLEQINQQLKKLYPMNNKFECQLNSVKYNEEEEDFKNTAKQSQQLQKWFDGKLPQIVDKKYYIRMFELIKKFKITVKPQILLYAIRIINSTYPFDRLTENQLNSVVQIILTLSFKNKQTQFNYLNFLSQSKVLQTSDLQKMVTIFQAQYNKECSFYMNHDGFELSIKYLLQVSQISNVQYAKIQTYVQQKIIQLYFLNKEHYLFDKNSFYQLSRMILLNSYTHFGLVQQAKRLFKKMQNNDSNIIKMFASNLNAMRMKIKDLQTSKVNK